MQQASREEIQLKEIKEAVIEEKKQDKLITENTQIDVRTEVIPGVDANGNKIDRAPNPMELLTITVPQEVKPGDMIRSTKEGLINLYQKDGSSKTVRA